MDSQLCRMASANLKEDMLLTRVVQEMSHLSRPSSLTFTATSLFETFSISTQLLHSASTGLYEVHALLLPYFFWVSLSRIRDFWKAGQQLVVQEVLYNPPDEFTTLGSFSMSKAAPIMREFVDIVNGYIEHEFLYCRNTSHVPRSYEIT